MGLGDGGGFLWAACHFRIFLHPRHCHFLLLHLLKEKKKRHAHLPLKENQHISEQLPIPIGCWLLDEKTVTAVWLYITLLDICLFYFTDHKTRHVTSRWNSICRRYLVLLSIFHDNTMHSPSPKEKNSTRYCHISSSSGPDLRTKRPALLSVRHNCEEGIAWSVYTIFYS